MNNLINKFSSFNLKQKVAVLFVFALLILLGITLTAVPKKQEIRPRAAGSGDVDLRFEPASGIKAKNDTFKVDLRLYKTASRNISSSGAQAVVAMSDKFTINSATCEAPFNGLPVVNISGQTVTFICGIALGTNPVALDATGKSFASVNVTIKNDAADGAAPVTFSSTRVTEAGQAGQAPDVSTGGQSASFTVGGGGTTLSPTPTVTASPLISPTPSPTGDPSACLPYSVYPYESFDGTMVDESKWEKYTAGNWDISIDQSTKRMKSSIIGSATSGSARLMTRKYACNDFDVAVDISQFTSDARDTGVATLSIEQQESNSAFYIEFFRNVNKLAIGSNFRLNRQWQDSYKSVDVTGQEGKLRIRRRGGIFDAFYNIGSGWQLLSTVTNGFSSNAQILIGNGSWNDHPSTYAYFDNFVYKEVLPDPTFTPVPSITLTPTATPQPTPPSGQDKYTIDVGDKQFLTFNIAAGQTPQIRFKAQLSSLQSKPQLFLKLRVKDELAFMKNPSAGSLGDSCNNPPEGSKDFNIPSQADGDVYKPVQDINGSPPAGAKTAKVSVDGWVSLDGVIPGRYYTLLLKGPKTRSVKVAEHVLLQPNQNTEIQDFDWTSKPIDPGDLPDPNNGLKQDCTVNSVDLSLITSRLGATDGDSLNIGDVNYDGIINGNDVSKVVNTLSTKPDDDL